MVVHGRFRTDNPMLSQLLLADGALTAYDLERLAVAPRQALLAACDSGVTRVHRGDELLGLAATLLAMGTSSHQQPRGGHGPRSARSVGDAAILLLGSVPSNVARRARSNPGPV